MQLAARFEVTVSAIYILVNSTTTGCRTVVIRDKAKN